MKIEIKKDIPKQYPSYQSLYVNGIKLGEYICGENKKYLDPEKWAKEQVRKRNIVLDRNILRLENELHQLKEEKRIINL
jgi:hypothetical protein